MVLSVQLVAGASVWASRKDGGAVRSSRKQAWKEGALHQFSRWIECAGRVQFARRVRGVSHPIVPTGPGRAEPPAERVGSILAGVWVEMNLSALLAAMIIVESGGNDAAIGDGRQARGALQIHACVVDDVNRIAGTRFTHRDAHRRDVAIWMATTYLGHYGNPRRLGRAPSAEDLARIWVGGPTGPKRPSTLRYWKRVERQLQKQAEPQAFAIR